MSWELVDWKSLFRSKVTSGITEDSEFYEICSFPSLRGGPRSGKNGFYLTKGEEIWFMNTSGNLSQVFVIPPNSRILSQVKDIDGNTVLHLQEKTPEEVTLFCLETQQYVSGPTIVPPDLRDILFHLARECIQDGVSWTNHEIPDSRRT